jgi:hypothetical protein
MNKCAAKQIIKDDTDGWVSALPGREMAGMAGM